METLRHPLACLAYIPQRCMTLTPELAPVFLRVHTRVSTERPRRRDTRPDAPSCGADSRVRASDVLRVLRFVVMTWVERLAFMSQWRGLPSRRVRKTHRIRWPYLTEFRPSSGGNSGVRKTRKGSALPACRRGNNRETLQAAHVVAFSYQSASGSHRSTPSPACRTADRDTSDAVNELP